MSARQPFEPELGLNEMAFRWEGSDVAGDIVCAVHYTPEERGTRDSAGAQADATLERVYVNGVDVTSIFDRARFGLRIEEEALRVMERRIKEARDDAMLCGAGL